MMKDRDLILSAEKTIEESLNDVPFIKIIAYSPATSL